jgi:alkylated DNA nucleotide flippase Atl1
MNPPVELPKVISVPAKFQKQMGGKRVLIPAPLMVDELVRKVRKGKLVTVGQLRECLAAKFDADSTCPMTMGIFLTIVAQAAEEDVQEGKKRIAPYWRVIKVDGSLNPKFPGGVKAQASRLKTEGHSIAPGKGKKPPKVKDFQKVLVSLPV